MAFTMGPLHKFLSNLHNSSLELQYQKRWKTLKFLQMGSVTNLPYLIGKKETLPTILILFKYEMTLAYQQNWLLTLIQIKIMYRNAMQLL